MQKNQDSVRIENFNRVCVTKGAIVNRPLPIGWFFNLRVLALGMMVISLLLAAAAGRAGSIFVPNSSFESPAVPQVSPYASPEMDDWEKSPQPVWYDPSQNNNTPWAYLMGCFYNVPFPGQFIGNCDGQQAAFLFAVPQAGLLQDYDTIGGTNTVPSHAFNAKFNVGSAYDLTVGLIGGGGGMQPGVMVQLSLYYRDASTNLVTVASTIVTNNLDSFPSTTNFVDFHVQLSAVRETDAWTGKNIGIQLMSFADFQNAGGYWDVDNVRLTEIPAPKLSNGAVSNGQFSFTVTSTPGAPYQIEASTTPSIRASWTSLGTFTNLTGTAAFTDYITNFSQRYYRARQM
ncbi:MAG TPA: hypothetical protein VL361_12115 [Candidatus Limnocylindrales bacterium]|nr:hypothetical protein [Candidatus Limnocylindrales bacterium]